MVKKKKKCIVPQIQQEIILTMEHAQGEPEEVQEGTIGEGPQEELSEGQKE